MKIFLLLLNVIGFWLLADPAHAGPVLGVIPALFASLGSVGSLIAKVLLSVALNLASTLLQKMMTKKQKQQAVGVKLEIQMGDDLPVSTTIGRYATAGRRKYAGTYGDIGGTPNAMFVDVIELGNMPVSGLDGLWIDDEKCTIMWDEETSRGFPIYQFQGALSKDHHAWIKFYDGTQTQPNAYLRARFGDHPKRPFLDTMIGRGCPYAVMTFRFNRDMFGGAPTCVFELGPLKLYDIRKDSSVGGNGPHRWSAPSTWEPSTNLPVMIYNIIRGLKYNDEWMFGGQDLAASRLPASNWIAAAQEASRLIRITDQPSEPQFRGGYEITGDMEPLDVIDDLRAGCAARLAENGGSFKIQVGAFAAAAYSISDADIIVTEDQSFEPFPGLDATVNAIKASYPEPDEKWASKDAPTLYRPLLEIEDGNRVLPADVQFPAVPYKRQVQRLMRMMIEEERRFRTHQFYLPPQAWVLEPNDVISWTSAHNGYENKKFVILSIEGEMTLNQLVTIKEIDPADYDWSPSFELPTAEGWIGRIEAPTQQMTGWAVEPSSIVDNNGVDRRPAIEVSCGADLDDIMNVNVKVRLKETGDIVFDSDQTPYSDPYSWLLAGEWLLPDEDYEVAGKYVPFTTRPTSWSDWLPVHTKKLLVSSIDVFDNAITQRKIADAAVSASKIMDDAVTSLKIADKAVSTAKISIAAVTADLIANQAIISTKLADAAVTAQKLAQGAVDATKFASGIQPVTIIAAGQPKPTVKSTETIFYDGKLLQWDGNSYEAIIADVGDGSITSAKLADAAVTAAKMADSTITATKFASSIKPVEVVSLLPAAPHVEGRIVFLTTDDKMYRNTGSGWVSTVAAVDVSGQLISSQISDAAITAAKMADAAITATKFAASVKPVEVVSVLPGTPHVEGRTVYLTTDDKMYRNTGSGWISTVAAIDLTGQIVATQISDAAVTADKMADAAITATKFAASIKPVEVVSALPGAPHIEGRTVFLTTDDKQYRNTGSGWISTVAAVDVSGQLGATQIADLAITNAKLAALAVDSAKIATNAITNTKIADDAISTPKLQANAVVADKIAAQAIVARHLVLTDMQNIVPNGDFADNSNVAAYWARGGGVSVSFVEDPANARSGVRYLRLDKTGTLTTSMNVRGTQYIPVVPGEVLYWEVAYKGDAAAGAGAYYRILWYDGSRGATITPNLNDLVGNQPIATSWTFKSGKVTVPPNADFAVVQLYNHSTNTTAALLDFDAIVLRRANAAQLIVDGSIVANMVAAEAITAGKIAANAVTSDTIAANAITAGKIAAAAVSADQIAANAVTAAKILAGAISADKLSVGTGLNQIPNADFAAGLTNWSVYYSGGTWAAMEISTNTYSIPTGSLKVQQIGARSNGQFADVTVFDVKAGAALKFPVAQGKQYEVSVYVFGHRSDFVRAHIEWRNAAGAVVSYNWDDKPTHQGTDPGQSIGNYVRAGTVAVAPPGAVYAHVFIRCFGHSDAWGTDSYTWLAHPYFGEATNYQTELSNWSSGAVTVIADGNIITGAVTADKVAANAITAGKIAAGAVTADTVAANAITAGKIAAAAVSADQIAANAITTVKLAADSVTTAKIAALNVTAAEIAANAIIAEKIAANAVTAGKINAGAVTAGTLAANAVTAGTIAAGAVSADQIAANAVIAAKIAAGAISADKLAVGVASNWFNNPDFSAGITGWQLEGSTSLGTLVADNSGSWTPYQGHTAIVGQPNNNTGAFLNLVPSGGSRIRPVEANQRYEVSGYLGCHRCTGFPMIAFLNSAGNVVAELLGSTNASEKAGGKSLNDFKRCFWIGNAPADAVAAIAYFRKQATNAGSDSYMFVTNVFFGKAKANQTEPSDWSSSGITLIENGNIVTNAITADKIQANAITAVKIEAGAIKSDKIEANAVTVGKIAAGAVRAQEIAADAITSPKILAGAISADKLAVGTGLNQIPNADFSAGLTGWSVYYSGGTWSNVQIRSDTYGIPTGSLQVLQSGARVNGQFADVSPINVATGAAMRFATTPGKRYEVSVYAYGHRSDYVRAHIEWRNAADGVIDYSFADQPTHQNGNPGESLGNYGRGAGLVATAPAGAVYAQVFFRCWGHTDAYGIDSYTWLAHPYFGEATNYQTELSNWSSGAVTLIADGHITTGAITADKIRAKAIVAGKLDTGAVRAIEIEANAVTADKIYAGSVTSDKIAANSIGSDKIAANQITARHLVLTAFDNLVPDNQMLDAASWANMGSAWGLWGDHNLAGMPSYNSVRYAGGNYGSQSYAGPVQGLPFPVQGGKQYRFEAWSYANDNQHPHVRFLILNGSGGVIAYYDLEEARASGVWNKSMTVTLPAGAATALIEVRVWLGASSGPVYIGGISVRQKNAAELIVDGSITASQLNVNRLDAISATLGNVNISNAIIGTLMVDKSNINNGAITQVDTFDSSATLNLTTAASVQVADVTVTVAAGENVTVWGCVSVVLDSNAQTTDVFARIYRGSTAIGMEQRQRGPKYRESNTGGSITPYFGWSAESPWQFVVMLKDTPGTGTFNYRLLVRRDTVGAQTATTSLRFLTAIVTKR